MAAASNNRVLRDHPVANLVLRAADAASDQREAMRAELINFEHEDFSESRKTLLRHMIAATPNLPKKELRQYMLAVFSPLLSGTYASRDKSEEAPIRSVLKTEEMVLQLLEFLPFDDAVKATLALETPCYKTKLDQDEFEPRIARLNTIFHNIATNHYRFRKEYTEPHLPSRRILGLTQLEDFNSSPDLESAVITYTKMGDMEKCKAMARRLRDLKNFKALECIIGNVHYFSKVKVKKLSLEVLIMDGGNLRHWAIEPRHLAGHETIEHLAIKHGEFPFKNHIPLAGFHNLHTIEMIQASFSKVNNIFVRYPQIRNFIFKECTFPDLDNFIWLNNWMPNLETIHFDAEICVSGRIQYLPSYKAIKALKRENENLRITINHLTGEQFIAFMDENERENRAMLEGVLNQARTMLEPGNFMQYHIPWFQPLQELLSNPDVSTDDIIEQLGREISSGIGQFNRFNERYKAAENARFARYLDPNTPPPTIPPPSLSSSSSSSSTSSSSSSLSSAAAPAAPSQSGAAAPPAGVSAAPTSRLASLMARLEQAQM